MKAKRPGATTRKTVPLSAKASFIDVQVANLGTGQRLSNMRITATLGG
jgi:hypothetical protein